MGVSCSPVPSMSSSTCSLTTASSTPSILLSDGPLYLQLQKLHISSYSVLNSLQTRSPLSRWKCLLLVIIVRPKGSLEESSFQFYLVVAFVVWMLGLRSKNVKYFSSHASETHQTIHDILMCQNKNTKSHIHANTQTYKYINTKCLKDPKCAMFLKSRGLNCQVSQLPTS